jgi:hypothetical protein
MHRDLLTTLIGTTASGGVTGIGVLVVEVITTTGTFQGPGWPH